MKVIDYLNNNKGKVLFSFEVLPPLKGTSINSLFNAIDPLIEFDPKFINVTYHREEYKYKERENGLLEKVSIRKRPGTVGICSAIKHKYGIDTVAHLICGGFTKEETENALIDLNFLGINNVLALRGDPVKGEKNFVPEKNGHSYAVELVKQIVNLNKGIYLDDEIKNASPTDFCIGVAAYPEKHSEAPNIETDLKHLKSKINAGAEYVITQLFYDNKKFFDFVKLCRKNNINVPIIPGLKPITSKKQISLIPKTFAVSIPEELTKEIEKSKDNKSAREIGIEWTIQQSKELIKWGVPCLHYYTMGNSSAVKKIASEIF